MKRAILMVFLCSILTLDVPAQERKIIKLTIEHTIKTDSIDLNYLVHNQEDGPAYYKKIKVKVNNGVSIWEHTSAYPLSIRVGHLPKEWKEWKVIFEQQIFEPGDDIRVKAGTGNQLLFEGEGTAKNYLLQEIANLTKIYEGHKNRVGSVQLINSLAKYDFWAVQIKNHMQSKLELLKKYEPNISPMVFRHLKVLCIAVAEAEVHDAFYSLCKSFAKGNESLSPEILAKFFDRDFYIQHFQWLRSQDYYAAGNISIIPAMVLRKYNFSVGFVNNLGKIGRRKAYLAEIKKTYKGFALEHALAEFMDNSVIHNGALEEGFPPEYDELIDAYYNGPYHPLYKTYVRAEEKKDRLYNLTRNGVSLSSYFTLPRNNGEIFDYRALKGKVGYLRFGKTGLDTSAGSIYQDFKADTNVLFLNISVEKDKKKWLSNLSAQKYAGSRVINLYTAGQGTEHNVLRSFVTDQYSIEALLYPSGKILPINKDESRWKENLLHEIRKTLPYLNDGPYVFHNSDEVLVYQINSKTVERRYYPRNSTIKIESQTDKKDLKFSVALKPFISFQPAEFKKAEKLFVLSDIEGNFEAFRKLLQANKIIDADFNWTFGNGHLVFAGDMFDRGLQVTECLWLVYALEEKAKMAGGCVHFILGNHEIMNLQGDHRYVAQKYQENAALMGKTLTQLYNEDSELGRWLRTKNIVEKIGDLLFTHGGISAEISRLKLPVEQINKLARPNYTNKLEDYKNAATNTIMNSTYGPFWYRGYYSKSAKASETAVDSILLHFKVKHIITGHTVVADSITAHYNNKVINTDTKHAGGKSEALLIEDANFYRVNAEGKRVLLFRDEEK